MAARAALGEAWDTKQKELQDQAEFARFREEHAEATVWIRVRRETVDGIEAGTSVAAIAVQIKKLGEQRVRNALQNACAEWAQGVANMWVNLLGGAHRRRLTPTTKRW